VDKIKVWAYCLAWNEAKMLTYYLRYYTSFCERVIVYDNESTDNSREICSRFPNVELRTFSTNNRFDDFTHVEIKTQCVHEARNQADFVIVGDCDEFVYHENMLEFLADVKGKYSVFYPAGFDMVTDRFPTTEGSIFDEVKTGVPSPWYSKPMLMDPNNVFDFAWVEGCHELVDGSLQSLGNIHHIVKEDEVPNEKPYKGHMWPRFKKQFEVLDRFVTHPLKMLHCKFLGPEYVSERHRAYTSRLSEENLKENLGEHYISMDIKNKFTELNSQVQLVI